MITHKVTFKDASTGSTVDATIEADEHGMNLAFAGYGDHVSADGFGRPVFIELHDGKLTIHVWTDIREEDTTHVLSLEDARESRRLVRE